MIYISNDALETVNAARERLQALGLDKRAAALVDYSAAPEPLAPVRKSVMDPKQKLAGIECISTTALHNKICISRMQSGDSVCRECYAAALLKFRKNCDSKLLDNLYTLNDHLLTNQEIGNLDLLTALVRIESFGDVASPLQAANYVLIMLYFAGAQFAVWTKNYAYYFCIFDLIGKPANCSFVVSSEKKNVPFDMESLPESWRPYVDHVFTVYDPEKYPKENMAGWCAGVRCLTCQKCYHAGGTFYINECLRTAKKANKAARAELEKAYNDALQAGR